MSVIIQTTDTIKASDGIKTLLYGASGIGKTRTSISSPRPFVLSAEKGLLSLTSNRIPYIDVSTYSALLEAYAYCTKSADFAKNVDTLYLDSLTEIAQVVLAEEKKKTTDARQAYMKMQDSIYALIRNFRDMKGKNVVLIAWEELTETGLNKKASPVIPSAKLQAAVPYFFDLVLHMHDGFDPPSQTSYQAFHTKSNAMWVAKDRGGKLNELEPCNMLHVFKKACGFAV